MKLSEHSKMRMRERVNLRYKNKHSFFRQALSKGKSINDIEDMRIRTFFLSKQSYRCRVKLYKDYVFIYSKNSKQLYTMYKLPNYLLNEEPKEIVKSL